MDEGTRAPARRKMHQTTVRFGEDLWRALDAEAKILGISAAQYVRDAALSRLSYEAGVRGDFEPSPRPGSGAATAQEEAQDESSASAALWAQGQLARKRAAELRTRTKQTRLKLVRHKT